MEKVVHILNELEKEGLITGYALGGAVAFLFYAEPVLTYDLDVFVFLPPSSEKLMTLSPIYEFLKKKGYAARQEHILIEGIPVQLIPAYNTLIEEAVKKARAAKYKKVLTKVIRPEHLLAIALQTGRLKDQERVVQLIKQTRIDGNLLTGILKKHNLTAKWNEVKKKAKI
ncbi:MAG: hypothetical protein HYU99_02420 [Deltaproteobacteria bacterium]|nr:hypothetical protein [Deltaproteobacteria bacterium]